MTSHVLQPAAAAMPAVEHILAVRGTGGYRRYRIPALAVLRQGTLLAAYDGRPTLDDLPNPIDLLPRRSTDNGRSWGEQQVVRTGGGLNGYGDPSLLVDVETGRIFMFHAAGKHAGFFEAAARTTPPTIGVHKYSMSPGAVNFCAPLTAGCSPYAHLGSHPQLWSALRPGPTVSR